MLQVGVAQPIITTQPEVKPAMSVDEIKRMDRFKNLSPPHFSSTPSEDAQDFLDRCHEILCNLGLVESNGVDFIVFHMHGSSKRWW